MPLLDVPTPAPDPTTLARPVTPITPNDDDDVIPMELDDDDNINNDDDEAEPPAPMPRMVLRSQKPVHSCSPLHQARHFMYIDQMLKGSKHSHRWTAGGKCPKCLDYRDVPFRLRPSHGAL